MDLESRMSHFNAGSAATSAGAAEQAELAQRIRTAERELLRCHQGAFPATPAPIGQQGVWYYHPPAEAPDLTALTVTRYEELTTGMPWYRVGARRQAKARALTEAVEIVQREALALGAEREHAHTIAEHERLLHLADVAAVPRALDDALADVDAVVERMEGGVALVRLLVPAVASLIGCQEPTQGPTGALTVTRRTAGRRHLLYAAVLASRSIRVAKVAFASVPDLHGVRIVIDQMDDDDIHPIYEGLIRRSARTFWNTDIADPEVLSRALPAAAEVVINLNAFTGQLHPIAFSATVSG